MNKTFVLATCLCFLGLIGCDDRPSSDNVQSQQQESILQEGNRQVGMPTVKNFRQRKMMKMIIEMCDQEVLTYTYTLSERNGKLRWLGETIGYPIPYSTQFTNPQKVERITTGAWMNLPQADPNGLFSPASSEGTWIMMKDPKSDKTGPVYVEPKVFCSPFKLPESMLDHD